MPSPRLTLLARQDLQGIAADLGSHSKRAAERLIKAIQARCELLAMFPHLGCPCDDIRPGLRFSVVRSYVIYYRPRAGTAEILRVVHGRRDLGRIFPS